MTQALVAGVGASPTPSSNAVITSAPARHYTKWELVHRIVSIALAVLALLILSPLMLLVALAVRLSSKGPVIYSQERVGIDRRDRTTRALYDRRGTDVGGSVFTIYKFRTMVADAERGTGPVWATQKDPRVTPVGRFLRATRLDELPQFLNVIKGDMNLVGPRPERPTLVVRIREDIPEYALRHRTRPGITGWAQINHNYDTCLDDVRRKVSYDLEYLERRSVMEDLRIMIKTVPVILFKRGGW